MGTQMAEKKTQGSSTAQEPSKLQEKLVRRLRRLGMTVTAVESCTGGMVAAALTSVPGSSGVLACSLVTYCDAAKHKIVGVKKKTLKKYTAVSAQTAKEMAQGGARWAGADCCVSVTGYAGPDSGSGEPVGLVYIGCCVKGRTKVREFHFEGDRAAVREQAVRQALLLLKKGLDRYDKKRQ